MVTQRITHELSLHDLADTVAQLTKHGDVGETPVPGLSLFRTEGTSELVTGMYEPSVCLIAQGAKQVILGDNRYIYDSHHYLFSGLHLPVLAQVIDACHSKPYLGLKLTFEYGEIIQLMADSQLPSPRTQTTDSGLVVGNLSLPLVNAFQRLVNLINNPAEIAILAPVIRREIFFRLLIGEQGAKLRQLATVGTQSQQIASAVSWLKANYKHPLKINALAKMVNMGVSTFHHHFRRMTALSPLQYQKQLRLQEARRMMLLEHVDAASASLEGGYESPSQFSREYSRLYGAPPARDVMLFRQQASNS